MYQALYRKWRPRRFDDVIGQSHITDTLKRQVETGRLSHAYLFTGTRGTGKTSCAKILAKAVNCESPVGGNPCNQCSACVGIDAGSILDILELDAASNNGVDQVRALRDEAVYTPAAVKKRVYIIDEVHMLSTPAFNALLKILEEPPEHLMFILATTELHKVPATIKSRCQQYAFKRIRSADISSQLQMIAGQEGITLSVEGAALLARLADGGLRDALSLLDQCIGTAQTLGEVEILDVLGLAGNQETAKLVELIIGQNTGKALECLGRLYRDGKDMGALLSELSALVRDLLIRKTAPAGADALLTGGYEDAVLHALSQRPTPEELVQMLTILQTASAELYRSSNRRTDAELCVIRLCEKQLATDLEGLAARISRLEEQTSCGMSLPIASVLPFPAQQELAEGSVAQQLSTAAPEDVPPWMAPTEAAGHGVDSVVMEQIEPPETIQTPSPQEERLPQPSSGSGWAGFVVALRGKISPSAYSFLGKAEFVTGVFDDKVLTIYADSEMVKAILSKEDVLGVLEREACVYSGDSLRIQIKVGKPLQQAVTSATTAPADRLDDLIKLGQQYDNITVK